jgi:hypothetical protein
MANTMLPQDYVDLTREFLAFTFRSLLPFTVETVTKYCIKKTPKLDPGDDEIIRQIVTETLEMYHAKHCIKKTRNTYRVAFGVDITKVEGTVFEETKPMGKISKEMADRLNGIDSRTRYNNDPISSMMYEDDIYRKYE